jgi:hypothetical protein
MFRLRTSDKEISLSIVELGQRNSKDTITRVFEKLLIGDVKEVSIVEKKADFVVRLYDTSCAKAFVEQLRGKPYVRLMYDEPESWKICQTAPMRKCVSPFKEICIELTENPMIQREPLSFAEPIVEKGHLKTAPTGCVYLSYSDDDTVVEEEEDEDEGMNQFPPSWMIQWVNTLDVDVV